MCNIDKVLISYDKDLPEIPGRHPSKLLLIKKLRKVVNNWRHDRYPEVYGVTSRLFAYWFDEDHEMNGFPVQFRYRFYQREAIETITFCLPSIFNRLHCTLRLYTTQADFRSTKKTFCERFDGVDSTRCSEEVE